ncbi:MAG: hypothetical protein KKB03_03240 [Nanoarchaeota archaeon]|nr:hypothetical protein [Nanoarchaeota archaeon]MBU1135164.1 hypothetical protein [Nanoarchaeota archaeon]MBU2520230.1 hypothetical protein [Nanoarchaeota archaeon]
MKKRKKKGQFFILGAIMLIILFFGGLQFGRPLMHQDTEDLGYIFDNIEYELPYALNLGINKTTPIITLTNFTRYLDESLYFANFSTLWVVTDNVDFGLGQIFHTVNVTVGNFLDYNVTVNVTFDGSSINVTVPNNQTNFTTFEFNTGAAPMGVYNFDLKLEFDGTTRYMNNTVLDKYNFYALVKLQRGNDFKKEEIVEAVDIA